MIAPVFLPHLGCGKRCIYCNQEVITDSNKEDGPERQIASLLDDVAGPVEVALYGGNPLGLGYESLRRLLSLFVPYQNKISGLRISTKPGSVDRKTLQLLKEHRVRTVELGTPTFNDDILDRLARGHTGEDARNSVKRLKEEGFETGMQLMVGLPGETGEDIRDLVDEVHRLSPAFIRIYPLVVIRDTPLCDMFGSGDFVPDPLERAVSKAAFIYTTAWSSGIPTIKMGLTDNTGLKSRIVAGPYHPAFGYLAKCEAFRLAVANLCKKTGAREGVRLSVAPGDVPHLIGYKSSNIGELRGEFATFDWDTDDSLEPGHFRVLAGRSTVEGSLSDGIRAGSPDGQITTPPV
jgi:hypothetical protein